MFGFLRRLAISTVHGGAGFPGGVTGSFDVRGGEIVGLVHTAPYSSGVGIRVEVLRRGRLVSSCAVGPARGDGAFPFSMQMDGSFTPEEIVRSAVTIEARTPRGDTGVLQLDGATALGLIRDHLGVPVEPILDLNFDATVSDYGCMGAGWSVQKSVAWAVDNDSFIHLPSPPAYGTYLLRMTVEALIVPMVPRQTMDIYVNEELVGTHVAYEWRPSFHEFRFGGEVFAGATTTALRLYHPYAARPSEVGENLTDRRRLAFGFRRLGLMRIIEEE